jgi:hypothetical protein
MGAGNSVDYWGELTFTATLVSTDSIVAPVPEPATLSLSGAGVMILGWAAYRRRRKRSLPSRRFAPNGAY